MVEENKVAAAPAGRILGTAKGLFVVPDDFDEPLPEDLRDEFGK